MAVRSHHGEGNIDKYLLNRYRVSPSLLATGTIIYRNFRDILAVSIDFLPSVVRSGRELPTISLAIFRKIPQLTLLLSYRLLPEVQPVPSLQEALDGIMRTPFWLVSR